MYPPYCDSITNWISNILKSLLVLAFSAIVSGNRRYYTINQIIFRLIDPSKTGLFPCSVSILLTSRDSHWSLQWNLFKHQNTHPHAHCDLVLDNELIYAFGSAGRWSSFHSHWKPTMKRLLWPFWRWARQLLRPFSWGGNLPIMCWHMPDNHCSINACSMCIWQACCWVCPPVVRLGFYILHPHIISLQVPSLYGMAAASRRVIGYWADCFACGPFFRPFVVSFLFFFLFKAPYSSLSAPVHLHVDAERAHTG